MSKKTPKAEYLARRLMQKLDMPGMTESEGKEVKILLDLGLPRKPREYDATIVYLRVMDAQLRAADPALRKKMDIPCKSVASFHLKPNTVKIHVYLDDNSTNYKVQVDEVERDLPPYLMARIIINGVSLGWFPPP